MVRACPGPTQTILWFCSFCARKSWMSRLELFGLEMWRRFVCVMQDQRREGHTDVTEHTRWALPGISHLESGAVTREVSSSLADPLAQDQCMSILIPCSSSRNIAWLPTGLSITKAITSAYKRLDPHSTCIPAIGNPCAYGPASNHSNCWAFPGNFPSENALNLHLSTQPATLTQLRRI